MHPAAEVATMTILRQIAEWSRPIYDPPQFGLVGPDFRASTAASSAAEADRVASSE